MCNILISFWLLEIFTASGVGDLAHSLVAIGEFEMSLGPSLCQHYIDSATCGSNVKIERKAACRCRWCSCL